MKIAYFFLGVLITIAILHWSLNVRDCPEFGPAKTLVVCPRFQEIHE
jgi:hypothetical protein